MHQKHRKYPKAPCLRRLPLAVAICVASSGAAMAQQAQPAQVPPEQDRTVVLDTVTVTAQKREENVQKVPISMQVLGTQQIEEMNLNDFDDYVRLMPSVSVQSLQPGFNQVYMRGVVSGGDGNHSGSLPSVGVYVDEQPITTIQGALDLHVYDIERVEALSGPQGTLYGASSQSGTLRIITNKPDPSRLYGGIGTDFNMVQDASTGFVTEGFVNIPVNDHAAVRMVGWHKHDAGYVNNVRGTRTFPSSGITIDNRDMAEGNYNDVDTTGARIALRYDLGDNWTITPTLMAQHQKANGSWAHDPAVGDLAITHFYPETSDDQWTQAALTVQGKVGNFDLTYAFADLKRDVDSQSDYNDYGFWYDTLAGYGTYFYDDDGALVNPSQYIQGKDGYRKRSHELRIASPQDQRLRFVAGVFVQDQRHDIEQRYRVDGLASSLSVQGWEDTIWLTQQDRADRDRAVFGELAFDITDRLTASAGGRYFRAHNGLKGFFGFATGYAPTANYGEASCEAQYGTDRSRWQPYEGAPCKVFDKEVRESGSLGRVNLTYDLSDSKMLYATWSEGYRPGGINRRGTLPPYLADFLTSYELGWKTTWAGNRLAFNGSVFQQDWKDFQFSILGANGLTEIKNANQARIRGVEMDLNWAVTYNFKVSGGFGYYDGKLTENYCGFTDGAGRPVTSCTDPEAPEGTRLPVTARLKGSLTGRYTWDVGGREAFVQGSAVHEGGRTSDLRLLEREIIGDLPAYTSLDLSAGLRGDAWSVELFVRNATDERAQVSRFTVCAETICGNPTNEPVPGYANGQVYVVTSQPRTFGVRFTRDF